MVDLVNTFANISFVDMINLETSPSPWYTKSMRTKTSAGEKRTATISAKVPPSVKSFVAELMALDDRTESYIVLALVERGIAQYQRDGLIIEPQRNDSHEKSSLKVPQSKKKAG